LAPIMFFDVSIDHGEALESKVSESWSMTANVIVVKPLETPSVSEVRKLSMDIESLYHFNNDGFAIKVPPKF
jgi:hypothetical protein